MKHSLVVLSMVGLVALGTMSGCATRRDVRTLSRIWRDTRGDWYRGVNINTASRDDLASLPGIGDADAARIIDHRPYRRVEGLVRKGVLSPDKFRRVRDIVYAS